MADPRLDYDIIFKTDDEIHDGVKMQFSFHGKEQAGGGGGAGGGQQQARQNRNNRDYSDHSKMTPADWEYAFE